MDTPFINGRAALADAALLLETYGDDAGFEAAARAEDSRDSGQCHEILPLAADRAGDRHPVRPGSARHGALIAAPSRVRAGGGVSFAHARLAPMGERRAGRGTAFHWLAGCAGLALGAAPLCAQAPAAADRSGRARPVGAARPDARPWRRMARPRTSPSRRRRPKSRPLRRRPRPRRPSAAGRAGRR